MIQLPMVLQAYTPQIHLGDWQIVVFVNRRRNRLTVERWHSSENSIHPMEATGQLMRINTGIRAFRRQMPVLSHALEKINVAGMSEEEVVEAVFQVLARVYRAAPETDQLCLGEQRLSDADFSDFLEERKQEALAALNTVRH